MVMRVACKCGTQLKLSEKHAGRIVKCPRCELKFRISAEPFGASGNAVAPTPIAAQAVQPPPETAGSFSEITPANLDDELLRDVNADFTLSAVDLLGGADAQNNSRPGIAPPAVEVDLGLPAEMPYARDQRRSSNMAAVASAAVAGPTRSFWANLGHAFLFPFATVGNAISTICLMVFMVFASFSCLGVFFYLYLPAVFMNIAADSASGSDDYNAASLEGGPWDAVVRPFFHFVGTFALAMSPSILYVILINTGVLRPNDVIFYLWTAFGIFLWPMLMLLAATESLGVLSRPQQVLESIFRTILPYLAIWGALIVATALTLATSLGGEIMQRTGVKSTDVWGATFSFLGGRFVGEALTLYFNLVCMRVIGLYYLHFKHRFTFRLE